MDEGKHVEDELHCEERPLRHAGLTENFRPDTSHHERMAGAPVRGLMRRFTARDGLSVSCFDLCSPQTFNGKAKSDPTFVVTVLLDCGGRSLCTTAMANAALDVTYEPETLIYTFTRAITEGSFDVPPWTRFRGVEVRTSHAFLEYLSALELFATADGDHPFHSASNVDLWLGMIPASSEAKLCAERILQAAVASPSDDLAVETNGLAILNLALASMRDASGVPRAELLQARPQLEVAKRLMLGNLAHPWTLKEIAGEAGLTEKRLKSGFRAAFGTPVQKFLQSARLSRARKLLEGGASVTDASLSVGYANPSHFAYLYRRTFGSTPSNRRSPRK
jgi:AraC-like DNA-binding protein